MVNSSTSKIIYIGAYVLAGIVLLGVIILSVDEKPIPDNLWSILTALGTFLMGAHIKAPVTELYPDKTAGSVAVTTVVPPHPQSQPVQTSVKVVPTEKDS